jgi:vancomycin resistance protein YoaR
MFSRTKLFLIILALPFLAYLFFEIRYFNAAYPNTKIGQIDVSGKTRGEIEKLLQTEFETRQSKQLAFNINNADIKSIPLTKDLVRYDAKKTTENAIKYGRSGSPLRQLSEKFSFLTTQHQVSPIYFFDKLTFDTLLADVLRKYEKEVLETNLVFLPAGPVLSPSKPGYLADREEIERQVQDYIELNSDSPSFTVKFNTVNPKITRENSQEALEEAKISSTKRITLQSKELPDKTWTINPEQLQEFLEFNYDEEQNKAVLTVANYKVASYSAQFAPLINKPPVEAKYEKIGDKVVVFEASQNGRELDTEKLTDQIATQAFNPAFSANIELPIKTLTPALALDKVNEYGIKELISSGVSNYKGSSQGRIHNIELASQKINGTVVKSNQTFSMYAVVGDIEKATGFEDSFVIKNGRTVPGIGGGVCQVSTTVFRAALNAGLQIVERHPHSYRIAYYERDSPPGLDASIYFPSWDLKFTNNTGNNILIQTKLDKQNATLTFNMYGVKDNRTVQIEQPQITNLIQPPPELRRNDDTIPKGIIRQIDFAAVGSDISVNRLVTKDGQTLLQDQIKSHYYPWQAVYLVGTN